ncbi:uncharacterized protein BT62DRAFT_1011431 [Guyanagaster necrorhizus]|uniref:Uncharacterized protein n=1 Tax=Guyanagaster necrorhizus TaxID=856835 RepID=A0A9P7VIF0_9AGAR|nr:uncharacterized protein BT62DRAFT_1011431 [Guyanagaster necrorhizus MCA 3950]KAG7441631.1 hypothetical protein BT62DRAFT_1011431 [Guyanagaster necrorhizus MCA 3950]
MSDLDADLYGDLYDTDFADQAQEEKPTTAPEQVPQEPVSTPASKPQQSAPVKPSPPSVDIRTPSYSTPAVQTPIAPMMMPLTQQIPTYEQPQDDYGDSSRADGVYQNISVAERTIRPSEMKDEG